MIDFNIYGTFEENVSFKTLTSFKIGGIAKYVVYPDSLENAVKLFKDLNYNYLDYIVLGKGSNIIVSSNDYEGIVVRLDKLDHIIYDDTKVKVGSGVFMPKLALETINNGLKGLEWAVGLPANIGGIVCCNAGCYLSEIFDFIVSVTVIENNEVKVLNKKDIKYSYRTTMFKETKKYIILEAVLELAHGDKESSMALVDNRKQRRLNEQPLDLPSVGSIFRNPEGLYAGKLIEDIGLKGYRVGGAEVSSKHANFIVNVDNATGEDILTLISHVKKMVREEYGIELVVEPEILEW